MKAIVVGAGIAGLAAAVNLGRRGWQVRVLERSPGLRDSGYMIDFTGSGFDAAEKMGLVPALRERGYDVEAIEFVNADDRVEARLEFKLAVKAVQGRWVPLMRGDLERVLFEALPDGVDLRYSAEIVEIANGPAGAAVTLADGSSEEADLVIGADGVRSLVRATIFGPERDFARYLGFHVAAFLFEDAGIRRRLGDNVKSFAVPGRQVGLYALRDERLASFLVHASDSPDRPASVVGELEEKFAGLGWYLPEMLAAARDAQDIYYDELSQIEMDRWHSGRVMLLGDAACAVTPLAGSGAAIAVGGAFVLAELLGAGGDIETALERFHQRLAPQVRDTQAAGRQMARWFVPRNRWDILMRNGFITLSGLPGLDRLLGRVLAPSTKSFVPH